MKTKFKRKIMLEELFSNYAFRILFDDPKLYDLKKVYISRNSFNKNTKNGIQKVIILIFYKHKKIIIKNIKNNLNIFL